MTQTEFLRLSFITRHRGLQLQTGPDNPLKTCPKRNTAPIGRMSALHTGEITSERDSDERRHQSTEQHRRPLHNPTGRTPLDGFSGPSSKTLWERIGMEPVQIDGGCSRQRSCQQPDTSHPSRFTANPSAGSERAGKGTSKQFHFVKLNTSQSSLVVRDREGQTVQTKRPLATSYGF